MPKKPFLKKIFGRKRNSRKGGNAPSRPTLSLLETIVGFPFRLLGYGFRALGLFHDTGVRTDADRKKRGSFGRTIKYLLWLPIRALQSPVTLFSAMRQASKTELLFGIPALVVLSLLVFVVSQVFAKADQITNRYERGLQTAVTSGNLQLAKTYFNRLEAATDLLPRQRLRWAKGLASMGAPKEARAIINNLAPDDKPGFNLAHQTKAISLAREFGKTRDVNILPVLKWHLENSLKNSPETQQGWATYYVAMENPDRAVQALRKAAETNPNYYLAIADIYERDGRNAESRLALSKAAVAFRSLLEQNELKHPVRIALAKVLYELDQLAEAEKLLQQGTRIQADESFKLVLSELYLRQYDKLRTAGQPSDEQLQLLMDAIETTPNYGPIYSRMIAIFISGTQSPASAKKIRNKFQSMLLESKPQPFAHFALSNIHWFEGNKDKSRFHMEQAYELDSSLVVVVNNMAWMLAHESEPDLERALEMSSIAIKQSPKDGRFQDTHGTVLLKMQKYRGAIKHLELALPFYQQNAEIHEKLAEAYSEIGMLEIAAMHRNQSTAVGSKKQ